MVTVAVEGGLRSIPGTRRGEALARYTSLGIGGPADAYAEPTDEAELLRLVQAARRDGTPLFPLGGGTNLLFDDAGFRGLVLSFRALRGIAIDAAAARVTAGAGARLLEVLAACERAGLDGFQFADGIPGTIGGALVTNAGTALGQLSDVLESVRAIGPGGEIETIPAEALGLSYRESRLAAMGGLAVSATLRLRRRGETEPARREAFSAYRKATQPAGHPNAGSIFKNPPGDSAGRLVDAAGLKGARIGNAEISRQHANFIVNLGGATAADVRALMRRAVEAVRSSCGVTLEPEIVLVGESGRVPL